MILSSFGIGRAVATLFAREGADISVVYLPDERADAEETKRAVEREGKECLLVAGNLMDNENCKMGVGKHVERHVWIDGWMIELKTRTARIRVV